MPTVRLVQVAALSLFVFALAVAPALAIAAESGTVEKWGEAQIKNGDKTTAKKLAVADALRQCIEYVVGMTVQSQMTQEVQETVKNNQNDFYQKVRDQMTTDSSGFVEKYDVLEEKTEGDVFKAKVRATVHESKIKAEVQKLADLIKAAGNPKLVLVIQEVFVGADGKKRVGKDSVLSASLEQELLARGFELRGQSAAKGVATDSIADYDRWLDNTDAVSKMARDNGGDIVVAGRVEVQNKGAIEDTAGLDALKGQIRIEITSIVRGINATSGEVFSAKPVQMSSMGINEERALLRAFKGKGQNLVTQTFTQLLEDLKSSFKKAADRGQEYVVVLQNVKSFKKQGRIFLAVLEKLSGVSGAKQKSFDKGELTVDVSCKCNASELQERIFKASESEGDLSDIDIEGVSGKKLSFKL